MKKWFLSLVLSVVLVLSIVSPTFAAWHTTITGIFYNFNASDSEAALTVIFGNQGKPNLIVRGNEFRLQSGETTAAQVEARIQQSLIDAYFVQMDTLQSFDQDDPVRQTPPILTPDQEIMTIKNKEYVATHLLYFKIHVYSVSPLRFVTCFSSEPITWQYW